MSWFLAKYQTLGNFSDTWLGKVKVPDCFHSDARELCAAGEEALRAKFRAEVIIEDPEEVGRQLACGTCLRIEDHARLLDSIAAAATPSAAPKVAPRGAAPRPAGAPALAPMDQGPVGIERGWMLSKAMGYL
mmetsp:Transcript_18320/g.59516  ORF Transcript_18320/g.59516 Transcript_18320/m.59516 type:complete len:132 (+) Transcript_18320:1371-1766(+)